MEDSISKRVYLVTAPCTSIAFAVFDFIKAFLLTLRTDVLFPVTLSKNVIKANVIIWKIPLEISNGVSHNGRIAPQALLVVKG